jgi:SAM-dependent methyltransferase
MPSGPSCTLSGVGLRDTGLTMVKEHLGVVRERDEPAIASELSGPDLPIEVLRTPSDLATVRERSRDRRVIEQRLCETLAGRETWTLQGVCKVCSRAVAFEGDWRRSTGPSPNFREQLVCPHCRLNNRMRFMAYLLRVAARLEPPQAPIYLYEQVTPFFLWAQQALPGTVIGSEYLGPDVPSGTTMREMRHEDALALSFEDASLDMIVSNDVFEHVPDIDRCLAESARVLRSGGRLLFSIPFYDREESVQRATVRDGEIVELLPPNYHGNPIDPEKGSLVFYEHGWDILERCRRAGFADAYAVGYWSLLYGHLGYGLQLVFVAEAPR